MISLVSAPVLGFDLVRHPAGSAIADVLLLGMTLGPDDLDLFRAAHGSLPTGRHRAFELSVARSSAWLGIREFEAARGPGSLKGSALAPDPTATGPFGGLVADLLRSMIVDLDDLDALIRRDVLAWCLSPDSGDAAGLAVDPAKARAAADALIDGVAALWLDGLDPQLVAILSETLAAVRSRLPRRTPDIGPCSTLVHEVLAALVDLSAEDRDRLRAVNAAQPSSTGDWSQAVHEASWAALATGRIRAAASVQLLAVRAFARSGFDALDGADGLWNAVSGHLQACVVADVLPEATRVLLASTWTTALS